MKKYYLSHIARCLLGFSSLFLFAHGAHSATNWNVVGERNITDLPGVTYKKAADFTFASGKSNKLYVAYSHSGMNYNLLTTLQWHNDEWSLLGHADILDGHKAFNVDIKADHNDVPYIVYGNEDRKATAIKWLGSWQHVGAEEGFSPDSAFGLSLFISSKNVPYVAYVDKENGFQTSMRYWNEAHHNWESVGLDGFSGVSVSGTCTILDSRDVPYVIQSYKSNNMSKIKVMRWNGESWSLVGDQDITPSKVMQFSCGMDKGDMPYIAYSDANEDDKLTVMYYQNDTWKTLGKAGFTARKIAAISLVFDHNNVPYVGYQDAIDEKAYVTHFSNGRWFNDNAVSDGKAESVQLAVDYDNRVYIAYKECLNNAETCATTHQITVKSSVAVDPPIPEAPSHLNLREVNGGIELIWQDNSRNEVEFKIVRDAQPLATTVFNRNDYVDANVICSKNYQYKVIASSAGGDSAPAIQTIRTTACPENPTNGSNADDTDKGNHTIADSSLNNHTTPQGNTLIQTDLEYYVLSVASPNTHVVSEPTGIDCDHGEGQCQAIFKRGTKVDLDFAQPLAAGLVFAGWEGSPDCQDSKLIINDTKSCLARVYGTKTANTVNKLRFREFNSGLSIGQSEQAAIAGFIFNTTTKQMFAIAGQAIDKQVDPSLEISALEFNAEGGIQDTFVDENQNIRNSTNAGRIVNLETGMYLAKLESETAFGQATVHIQPVGMTVDTEITNISTRGTTEGNGIKMQFSLYGTGSQMILIAGEALQAGVNPSLSLYKDGELLAQNTSWLNNTHSFNYRQFDDEQDAAILTQLTAGEYEVHLNSLDVKGLAIVEVNIVDAPFSQY